MKKKVIDVQKLNKIAQEPWRCENCKFLILEDTDGEFIGHCSEGVSDGSDYTNYQVADNDVVDWYEFGCIKFEEK